MDWLILKYTSRILEVFFANSFALSNNMSSKHILSVNPHLRLWCSVVEWSSQPKDKSSAKHQYNAISSHIRIGCPTLAYSPASPSCTHFTPEPGVRRFLSRRHSHSLQPQSITASFALHRMQATLPARKVSHRRQVGHIWSGMRHSRQSSRTHPPTSSSLGGLRYTTQGLSNTVATHCHLSSLSAVELSG